MQKLVLLFGLMLVLSVRAAAEDVTWKEFVYPDDNFAISAPGEPTLEMKTLNTAGGSAEAHVYAMPTGGNGAFMVVVHTRRDSDQRSTQEILDEARVGVLREANAMVLVQSNVSLGPYRGAQLELRSTGTDGNTKRVSDRFYIVGRKLYQLVALAPAGEPLPAASERWFDSFRLLGGKAP